MDVYSPDTYTSLPSLRDAATQLAESKGTEVLDGPIRQLFVQHSVYEKYGVALLHKHFSIGTGERLVDFHHTATPWLIGKDKTAAVIPHHDGYIVPRAYAVTPGQGAETTATPYEFSFTYDKPKAFTEAESAFFKEFAALLIAYQLHNVLGLCTVGDPEETAKYPVEITEGKANIMIKGDQLKPENVIEAVWTFDADQEDGIISRRCFTGCKRTGSGHATVHQP